MSPSPEWPLPYSRLTEEEVSQLNAELERRVLTRTTALVETARILRSEITDRKHASAQLDASLIEGRIAEQARGQFAAIVESSDDAIISKTLGGVIVSWNLGAEKLFGYSAKECIGTLMPILFPPERAMEESEILSRVPQGEGVDRFETVRLTKSGASVDVSITISPIRDNQGVIIGASQIARDITERRRAQEEIRRLNTDLELRVAKRTAELEAANKELEAFSYSISHDLRAPLRAVNGFAGIVLEDFGSQLPEEGRQNLQRIQKGGQRMGELIDDLLTFSRLSRQPVNRLTVDTNDLVQDVLDELTTERDKRQIEFKIEQMPSCLGDPALLKQVWINLLSNAIKYTRSREPAMIEVGGTRENAENIYFVRDNGVGFDMQYADKLFGVFQRLHRAEEFEGSGVGLAIVQRIVQRHGGRVWADAKENEGCTFYFAIERDTQYE